MGILTSHSIKPPTKTRPTCNYWVSEFASTTEELKKFLTRKDIVKFVESYVLIN